MLGVILSEKIDMVIEFLLTIAAVASAFVAVRSYMKTNRNELAKKIDLDAVNDKVMKSQTDITEIKDKKASIDYVDTQIRGVHHRVGELREDVNYIKGKTDDMYKILIDLQSKKRL